MMKKIYTILLLVFIAALICACGSTVSVDEVKAELANTGWDEMAQVPGITETWHFTEDEVMTTSYNGGQIVFSNWDEGTYEVTEEYISITWETPCDRATEIYYTMDNGELELFFDAEKTVPLKYLGESTVTIE